MVHVVSQGCPLEIEMWEERAIRFMSEARQVIFMANKELGGSIHV